MPKASLKHTHLIPKRLTQKTGWVYRNVYEVLTAVLVQTRNYISLALYYTREFIY